MNKLKEAIQQIGRDIGNIEGQQASLLSQSKAYELFPTYATLQSQMTSNIKDKHLELGLDALIEKETGMPVHIAQTPLDCVAMGTGKVLDDIDRLRELLSDDTKSY